MGISEEYVRDLIEKYGNSVLHIAYTYLKNMSDAEDIMQDVFLKIINKVPKFNDETHEKAWIMRTSINMCKNKINLFWNKNRISSDNLEYVSYNENFGDDSTVIDAVLSLPQNYRIVIYLYYYEGYSTKEIAELINKSDSTVRSSLLRARLKLKDLLKEEYDFEK